MSSKKKIVLSIAAGTLVLAMVAGGAGFYAFSNAQAQESLLGRRLNSVVQAVDISDSFGDDDFAHRGVRPDKGDYMIERGSSDAYLAEALGISEDELTTARQAAWEKALAQAVDDGLITQKQADWLTERPMGIAGRAFKMLPWLDDEEINIDYDALLAAELGITTGELTAAREKASELALQAAIDAGRITQEQADWMKARQALQPYIDRQALSAAALGMTVEELDTARQERKDMQTLLDEQGLTAEEYQAALQEAYKAALQRAVDDGVITQEQMDELLSQQSFGYRMPGMPGMDDFGRQRGGGRFTPNQLPNEDSDVTPDSDL